MNSPNYKNEVISHTRNKFCGIVMNRVSFLSAATILAPLPFAMQDSNAVLFMIPQYLTLATTRLGL